MPFSKRIINLDFLRVFAACSVALFHYTVQYPIFSGQESPFLFHWIQGTINLFFMISGFVILLSYQRHPPLSFFTKRFKAIYLPFLICCSISAIVLLFSPYIKSDISWINYFYNISLIAIFTDTNIAMIDGAYWTLAYEIGFYAFIGLFFNVVFRKSINFLLAYLYMGSFIFYLWEDYIPSPLNYFLMIHSYSHLFAYGIMLYSWWRYGFQYNYLIAPALTITLHLLHHKGIDNTLSIATFVALFPILIFHQLPWNRIVAFICSLGSYTYIFYLLHQMIGFSIIYQLQYLKFSPMVILMSVFLSIALLCVVVKRILGYLSISS